MTYPGNPCLFPTRTGEIISPGFRNLFLLVGLAFVPILRVSCTFIVLFRQGVEQNTINLQRAFSLERIGVVLHAGYIRYVGLFGVERLTSSLGNRGGF